jgi:ATP-dependent DNA helicase RecQ
MQKPPYIIFDDDTLRELARRRPSSPERMLQVRGVGEAKLKNFGPRFLPLLAEHCRQHGLDTDCGLADETPALPLPSSSAEPANWWEGVDVPLFRALRQLQGELAEERQAAPQAVLSELTLRDLARVRPSSREAMLPLYGVSEAKLAEYGERFLALIREHCARHRLSMDNPLGAAAPPKARSETPRMQNDRKQAYELFREQRSVEAVVERTGWGKAKVYTHLAEYVNDERPASVSAWVADDVYQRVATAARRFGMDRLKPIYVALGEQVTYDDIRLVLAHMRARERAAPEDAN